MQALQRRPYTYHTMWLPHDAQAKSLGTGRSIEEMARAAGWRVRIVPRLSVHDGINALRTLFPTVWFDRDKCADGVQALRHYRFDVDANTGQFSRNPLHDNASHGADAARYIAVAMQENRRGSYPSYQPPKRPLISPRERGSSGWMRG
jgi:phage terminase large subunit